MNLFTVGNVPEYSDTNSFAFQQWFKSVLNYIRSATTVIAVTTTYSVGAAVALVTADVTTAGFTVTLPLAADNPGRQISVIKIDASGNTLTVGRSGSDLINGATTSTTSTRYQSRTYMSDGISSWYIL